MAACDKCLWRDKCHTMGECTDYTPIDVDVEQMIEEGRYEFRGEWNIYVPEANN